jgi:hypothetical protein
MTACALASKPYDHIFSPNMYCIMVLSHVHQFKKEKCWLAVCIAVGVWLIQVKTYWMHLADSTDKRDCHSQTEKCMNWSIVLQCITQTEEREVGTWNSVSCAESVVASVWRVWTFRSSSVIYRAFLSFERAADCLFATILHQTKLRSSIDIHEIQNS